MPRRWTILIVPDGTESPKSYVLGERRLRVLVGVAVALMLVVGAAAVMLFTPWATPSARLAARELKVHTLVSFEGH